MKLSDYANYLRKDNCVKIGKILKKHGVNGHVVAHFFISPIFFEKQFIFVCLQESLVPFVVEYINGDNHFSSTIVKLRHIDNVEKAEKLVDSQLFFPSQLLITNEDLITDLENFVVGFSFDYQKKNFRIEDYIEHRSNPLFVITDSKKQYIVPSKSIIYKKIDIAKKVLELSLGSEPVVI